MEYAVVPLVFGIITGMVGKSKGSSFVIWFIVGALLPVIGLIAASPSRSERYDPAANAPTAVRWSESPSRSAPAAARTSTTPKN